MLHSPIFPSSASQATIAAYFLYGLEAGLFLDDGAREWAFNEIEASDNPSVGVIEVACAKGREAMFNSLGALVAGSDTPLAGRWLLCFAHRERMAGHLSVRAALRKAMQVASSTRLPSEVYYDLDGLEDSLWLAENDTYGSVEQIGQEALEALASHGVSPTSAT